MTDILIADDEKLIRAGIRKILEDYLGEKISCTEVKNGNEAYDLCQSKNFDILITDIRMPVMTGLELMEKVSQLEDKPAIIVLSGFDDFSYAKAAINSEALAYVLKPVDVGELKKAVDKALSSRQKQDRQKNENKIRALVSTGHPDEEITKSLTFVKDGYFCMSLRPQSLEKDERSLFSDIPVTLLESKNGCTSLLVAKETFSLVQEKFMQHKYFIGVSSISSSLSDLRRLRQESFCALLEFFFHTGKENIFFAKSDSALLDASVFDTSYDKVTAGIDLLNEESVRKSLRSLLDFGSLEKEKQAGSLFYVYTKIISGLFTRYSKITNYDSYLYLKSLMIENICTVSSLEEWKKYVQDYVLYLLELVKKQHDRHPTITKSLDYIAKHYKEDITMAIVANEVSMNYTWFSEKFKEQLGINFNDYLKRFRMDKAKGLLEKGTYKVYEVAEKCGFKDVKHFMKLFREMNGMSAGEWARNHSGKN